MSVHFEKKGQIVFLWPLVSICCGIDTQIKSKCMYRWTKLKKHDKNNFGNAIFYDKIGMISPNTETQFVRRTNFKLVMVVSHKNP